MSERPWVVLGDSGISYGPFSRKEAEAFAAQGYGRLAVSLDGARSQIETCVKYGFDFKPSPQTTAEQSAPDSGVVEVEEEQA